MNRIAATLLMTLTCLACRAVAADQSQPGQSSEVDLAPRFFIVNETTLQQTLSWTLNGRPVTASDKELIYIQNKLTEAGAQKHSKTDYPGKNPSSGGTVHVRADGGPVKPASDTNGPVEWPSTATNWTRMDFWFTPIAGSNGLRCEMALSVGDDTNAAQKAEVLLEPGGGMIWVAREGTAAGMCQVVVLHPTRVPPPERTLPRSVSGGTSVVRLGTVRINSTNTTATVADGDLQVRTFRFEPKTLFDAIEAAGAGKFDLALNHDQADLVAAMSKFLITHGVKLDMASGHVLLINPRNGVLLARTTPADLDKVESVMESLNISATQIAMRLRFVEVLADSTSPDVYKWLLERGLTNAPEVVSGHGRVAILQSGPAEIFYQELLQRPGTILLNEGGITTLSGKQAQFQAADLRSVVTNIHPQALTPPGIQSTNHGAWLDTSVLSIGTVIDVSPRVELAQGKIRFILAASQTEFLGYGKPGKHATIYVNGRPTEVAIPSPNIRTRSSEAEVVISETQAVVMLVGDPVKPSDPTFAPHVSRQTIVFLFGNVIDQTGNRVLHTKDFGR